METTDIRTQIQRYIADELAGGRDPAEIGLDDSLIAAGLLDSLALLQLILFLEERFGVKVEDGEVVPDNFQSIERIAAFLQSKAKSAA